MPTNLYGSGDNFDLANSHVIPALLRKCHEAQASGAPHMQVWGSGNARREFLHVDDLAAACLFLMELPRARWEALGTPHVNVGWGEDLTIRELAETIRAVVGYSGALVFDPAQPDGTPRKLLDCALIRGLGWSPRISLRSGLESTYQWFAARSRPDAAAPTTAGAAGDSLRL
jgi:GDP-L-fucose synthase